MSGSYTCNITLSRSSQLPPPQSHSLFIKLRNGKTNIWRQRSGQWLPLQSERDQKMGYSGFWGSWQCSVSLSGCWLYWYVCFVKINQAVRFGFAVQILQYLDLKVTETHLSYPSSDSLSPYSYSPLTVWFISSQISTQIYISYLQLYKNGIMISIVSCSILC